MGAGGLDENVAWRAGPLSLHELLILRMLYGNCLLLATYYTICTTYFDIRTRCVAGHSYPVVFHLKQSREHGPYGELPRQRTVRLSPHWEGGLRSTDGVLAKLLAAGDDPEVVA